MPRHVPVNSEGRVGGSSRQLQQGPHPQVARGAAGGHILYEGQQGSLPRHRYNKDWNGGYGDPNELIARGGTGGRGQGNGGQGQGQGGDIGQGGGGRQQGAGHGQGGAGQGQGAGPGQGDAGPGLGGGGGGQGGAGDRAGHGRGRLDHGQGLHDNDGDPYPHRDPSKSYGSDHLDLIDTDYHDQPAQRFHDSIDSQTPTNQLMVYAPKPKKHVLYSLANAHNFHIQPRSVSKEQAPAPPTVDPQKQARTWINNTVGGISRIVSINFPKFQIKQTADPRPLKNFQQSTYFFYLKKKTGRTPIVIWCLVLLAFEKENEE